LELGEIEEKSEPLNALEESISMLERTSMKLYPVVKEVLKRTIVETTQQDKDGKLEEFEKLLLRDESQARLLSGGGIPDMRSVLGFLKQNEWVYGLNIGNIMQLQPINLKKDMLTLCRNECELTRDSFLEKIALLGVSYFCVSTETRFILQNRE
jgi:hypothetical protein